MTPTEIKENYTATMQHYLWALDQYTDEQFAAKPSEHEWSLGQIYEHLFTANTYFFQANVKRCLEQRKGQEGGDMNDNGRNIFKYNSFPPIKVKIPAALRGPEPVARTREAYRSMFQESLQNGLALADAIREDSGVYKTLNPTFGWLNAEEWFRVGEMHARHHLSQQKEREEWLEISHF